MKTAVLFALVAGAASRECVDYPLAWVDTDTNDCVYYADDVLNRCDAGYAEPLANGGYNGLTACCACGGGCYDSISFLDSINQGCDHYATNVTTYCDPGYADLYVNLDGLKATDSCCVCGGGGSELITTPTTTPTTTLTTTPSTTQTTTQTTTPCHDTPYFLDSDGNDCDFYAGDVIVYCENTYAVDHAVDGHDARDECCVCGGGHPEIITTFTSTPTTSTTQTTTPTTTPTTFTTTTTSITTSTTITTTTTRTTTTGTTTTRTTTTTTLTTSTVTVTSTSTTSSTATTLRATPYAAVELTFTVASLQSAYVVPLTDSGASVFSAAFIEDNYKATKDGSSYSLRLPYPPPDALLALGQPAMSFIVVGFPGAHNFSGAWPAAEHIWTEEGGTHGVQLDNAYDCAGGGRKQLNATREVSNSVVRLAPIYQFRVENATDMRYTIALGTLNTADSCRNALQDSTDTMTLSNYTYYPDNVNGQLFLDVFMVFEREFENYEAAFAFGGFTDDQGAFGFERPGVTYECSTNESLCTVEYVPVKLIAEYIASYQMWIPPANQLFFFLRGNLWDRTSDALPVSMYTYETRHENSSCHAHHTTAIAGVSDEVILHTVASRSGSSIVFGHCAEDNVLRSTFVPTSTITTTTTTHPSLQPCGAAAVVDTDADEIVVTMVFDGPDTYWASRDLGSTVAVTAFEKAYDAAVHEAFCTEDVVCSSVESCLGSIHTTITYDVSAPDAIAALETLLETIGETPSITVDGGNMEIVRLFVQYPETSMPQSVLPHTHRKERHLRDLYIAVGVIGGLLAVGIGAIVWAGRNGISRTETTASLLSAPW